MSMRLLGLLGVSLLAAHLVGCSPVADALRSTANAIDKSGAGKTTSTPDNANAAHAQSVPVPDASLRIDTPDMAVKSHFDFVKRAAARRHNELLARPVDDVIKLPEAASLYAGNVRRYFDYGNGIGTRSPTYFYRQNEEIVKVESESDTRAVVTVRVTLDGEVSPKASKRGIEQGAKLKSEGEVFRFVMTKTEKGWAIENILAYTYDYSQDKLEQAWRPIPELTRQDQPEIGHYPAVDAAYGYF
jgi:hypothetical protein